MQQNNNPADDDDDGESGEFNNFNKSQNLK